MKKRIISVTLAAVFVLASVLSFSGCQESDYPVDVANITIENEPENIVVLDPSAADIISYMEYDVKMVGRSDEVNQEWMSIVPSVGSENTPDVSKIVESEADIVFAGADFDKSVEDELKGENITVIKMSQADTVTQLETNYLTIGKILGGKFTGAAKGEESYESLIGEMEQVKSAVQSEINSDILYTVCYLYIEDNSLKLMTSGSYGDMLLGYTGAVNTAVNIDENSVDVNTLKIANPNFIFYADNATLEAVKKDSVLSKLDAVKNGKTLMITQDDMTRQGRTALDTLEKMVSFMYPSLAKSDSTPDQAQPATVNGSSAQASNTSVADDYNIKLDGLSLKYEDENENVKIMQQRLYDLGYVDDKENITGYYGDISKSAVESFQSKNGIKKTGNADNETLVKMFDSEAVKK